MNLLIVDDSPTQRALWLYALSGAGLQVQAVDNLDDARRMAARPGTVRLISVKNPLEALDCLRALPITLLMTDVEMPEMSGWDLALQAQRMQPGLAVMVVSSTVTTGQALPAGLDEKRAFVVAKKDRASVVETAKRLLPLQAA